MLAEGNSPIATQSAQHLLFIKGTVTQECNFFNTKSFCGFWPDAIHNGTASHCSQNLDHHVEKGPKHTYLAAGQEAEGDGRIQVGTADVTDTLGQCRTAKPKANTTFISWSG